MVNYEGIIKGNGLITIDGYSTNKTLRGVLNDIARCVAKYDEIEARMIREMEKEEVTSLGEMYRNGTHDDYFLTIEEVPCACNFNDETDEMEYKDGNFYFCVRFVHD